MEPVQNRSEELIVGVRASVLIDVALFNPQEGLAHVEHCQVPPERDRAVESKMPVWQETDEVFKVTHQTQMQHQFVDVTRQGLRCGKILMRRNIFISRK